jgi:DNA mismatch endonuclease, patch repair protein
MDVHSKKQRSFNMSQIKATKTRPEELINQFLKNLKVKIKRHSKKLPGKPDFYLPDYNIAIEVRGCFWHGHLGCKYFVMPKSNVLFWQKKIEGNVTRDIKNLNLLKKSDIKVLVLWECDIKSGKFLEKILGVL